MKIIDISNQFENNFIKHKRVIVFHWTATKTAQEAIDFLKLRLNGKGTVGYNYIIEKNGDIYMLANPCNAWMHNSARGTDFDKNTISISFVNIGDGSFTEKQYSAAKELFVFLKNSYQIEKVTNHHLLYPSKADFPLDVWKKVKVKLGIK